MGPLRWRPRVPHGGAWFGVHTWLPQTVVLRLQGAGVSWGLGHPSPAQPVSGLTIKAFLGPLIIPEGFRTSCPRSICPRFWTFLSPADHSRVDHANEAEVSPRPQLTGIPGDPVNMAESRASRLRPVIRQVPNGRSHPTPQERQRWPRRNDRATSTLGDWGRGVQETRPCRPVWSWERETAAPGI